MSSKSKQSKIDRKQKRCQVMISKETNIAYSETPSKYLAICNAGLSTGLSEEDILQEALEYGNVEEIVMIPRKSYCFMRCFDANEAEKIFLGLHGKSKLGQNNTILYLAYFENIPKIENPWNIPPPPGLILLQDFISEEEEITLLKSLFYDKSDESIIDSSLKHRQVKHFGYEFIYGSNQVDPNKPLTRKIPSECNFLWSRLKENIENIWDEPDQLTVNKYYPGQGIPPHVDTHSAFLDPILSISLEGDTVMEFKKESIHASVLLPKRSLLIMSGESRYDWTHAIIPRHIDFVPSKSGGITAKQRNNRTSLTFRKLRKEPCNCSYPTFCDTKKNQQKSDISKANLSLIADKLELNNVHKVYDEIANHFSETRHTPWPKVAEFINSFSPGSLLLDVGCGNGKYLNVNEKIVKIGCDRSLGLLKVCRDHNFNIFQCDCLNVPFRDNTVDGCISIAVIHHLATEERRLKAINEMVRILVPGGKALIYVWSKNQQADSKKSSYLRQKKKFNNVEPLQENLDLPNFDVDFPIHTNRTQFQEQDVFVPWKLKSKENLESNPTFLRFYHVFEERELENLCKNIKEIQIVKHYYDQGNWCIIFEKL